jgi:acetyl-CoA carboxylase biotin carboxyl carrier protein
MVGTAYLAPDPQSRPFVSEGERVAEGQTLLIVEAMKVMNPIPAPRSGTITSIVIESGQPVEYGQVLLVIE